MFGLTPYERKNSAMSYDPFKAFENFEREFFKANTNLRGLICGAVGI